MLQISWRSEYGLLFLAALAETNPKRYVSLSAVAFQKHLPYRFLSQIASDLKKQGLVGSKEGARGGYYLLRPLATISLTDVIGALEKPVGIVDCLGEKGCKRDGCEVKALWKNIQQEVTQVLDKHTVADLLTK